MVRKFIGVAAVLTAMALPQQTASAQDGYGFAPGRFDAAFGVGFGDIGEASSAYSLKLEYGLRALGNGTLGIQAGAGLYSWDFPIAATWQIWPLTLTANYHFGNEASRLQPFVGAGAGYKLAKCTGDFHMWRDCSAEDDEFIPVVRAGGRFFFGQRVGLYADAGYGGPIANVGFLVRLK